MPVLSRGKHRSPRKGASFMQMASYLAGEPWSDRPCCTHPLLAQIADLVNEHTADRHRPHLAELIPAVIGLTTQDPHADACIALRCATTALPIASAERQTVMAVGVFASERALAMLEGRPLGELRAASVEALGTAPLAAGRARSFAGRSGVSVEEFRVHSAPRIARIAVLGIAEACVADPDERLHDLLVAVIDECAAVCARGEMSPDRSDGPYTD